MNKRSVRNPHPATGDLRHSSREQLADGLPELATSLRDRLHIGSSRRRRGAAAMGTCPLPRPRPSRTFETHGDLLAAGFLVHIPDTYDTYQCVDCDIILSGYKRGDPEMSKHVQSNRGDCRYVKAVYEGREKELVLLKGRLRFQKGFLAFPDHVLYTEEKYAAINGAEHCVVCAQPSSEPHYVACADMAKRLKTSLKHFKLNEEIHEVPLFTRSEAASAHGRQRCRAVQRGLAHAFPDFSVLGEPSNMLYVPGTVDMHECRACKIRFGMFVENDTFLGEHIYHCHNIGRSCTYLMSIFQDRQHELTLVLAKERYRKGYLALPDHVIDAKQGYAEISTLNFCVVCGAKTHQARFLPQAGHRPGCDFMKESLRIKLRTMRFITT